MKAKLLLSWSSAWLSQAEQLPLCIFSSSKTWGRVRFWGFFGLFGVTPPGATSAFPEQRDLDLPAFHYFLLSSLLPKREDPPLPPRVGRMKPGGVLHITFPSCLQGWSLTQLEKLCQHLCCWSSLSYCVQNQWQSLKLPGHLGRQLLG